MNNLIENANKIKLNIPRILIGVVSIIYGLITLKVFKKDRSNISKKNKIYGYITLLIGGSCIISEIEDDLKPIEIEDDTE